MYVPYTSILLALLELNQLSIPSEVIFNPYIHYYSALYLKEMSGSSQRQHLNPISEPEHKYKKKSRIQFTEISCSDKQFLKENSTNY